MQILVPSPTDTQSPLSELFARVAELAEAQDFSSAIELVEKALEIAPDHARLLATLGRLYLETSQEQKALAPLRRAVSINPKAAIAHWQFGIALQMSGDADGAMHELTAAVALRPDLADAHFRIGNLHKENKRDSDAIDAYRHAAAATPDPGEKKVLQAEIARMEGHPDQAATLLKGALDEDPDLQTAHGTLGQILFESGKFEDASWHLAAQLDRTPRAGYHGYNLVRCKKITSADAAVLERVERGLSDENLDPLNRSLLLLARGKVMDDLGRYEEAMQAFDEASELRRSAFKIDVRDFERLVDKIIALFSAEAMNRLVSRNEDRTPVLIVGLPRSGTTLVEQIIDSHSEVTGAGELAFWRQRLGELTSQLFVLDSAFISASAADYLDRLRGISASSARITDKDPFNFLALGLIHLTFPQAAIIHCRRNPLDTALSIHQTHFSKASKMPTTSAELVRYFQAYRRLMAHWRAALPENRILELEYERLTLSPHAEIRRVIDYIGLPWDASCLTPHVNNRLIKTPSGWQVRQSINTASIDRWKNYERWLGPLSALREKEARQVS